MWTWRNRTLVGCVEPGMKRLVSLLVVALSLVLSLAAYGTGGPSDEAVAADPDWLAGAELSFTPAGCGMCPLSFQPPTYRFFADGRVEVKAGPHSQVPSGSYRLSPDRVRKLERRAREEGLAVGDSRRFSPGHVYDRGEAELQVRLDGRLTTRRYAEVDGYHLIAFGRWLAGLAATARATR